MNLTGSLNESITPIINNIYSASGDGTGSSVIDGLLAAPGVIWATALLLGARIGSDLGSALVNN